MPGDLPAAGASTHPALETWLAALAGHGAGLGAGPGAAVVVGLAADLVATAASASPEWDGAPAAGAQARTIAGRAGRLAREDADAYAIARTALAAGTGDGQLGAALDRSRALLLAIAEAAADAAGLAALVVESGGPARRADAAGAALLACAAAESAVHLAAVNLAARAGDAGTARGADVLLLARAGARRALAAST